jgi:peptidoglycan-associated lipoprotein
LVWRQFDDVRFDVNKAGLRPSDADRVLELAAYLKQNPTFRVELEGFADPRGSDAYNMKLSMRRVNAVRDALIAAGVQKERILIGAYGELNLKCTQNAEECYQQDRRVEMIVLPTTDSKATTLRTGSGK